MKVYVQWTTEDVEDWKPLEANAWKARARKPLPQGGETIDNAEGWVFSLNCQGVEFSGFDHYAVEPLPGNGCRVTVWNDDPEDFSDGLKFAQVWEFLPPAPDQRIGGRMNTRQALTLYADNPSRYSQSDIMAEPCKPWSEFSPPPDEVVRHGISVEDEHAVSHRHVRSHHGWREWAE